MSILCGTDFSERSLNALHAAAAISVRLGRPELHVAHVLDGTLVRDLEPGDLDKIKARARARLNEEIARLRERFQLVDVTPVLLTGATSEALADLAASLRVSLVVVASQGHGSSALFRIGGTSERLAATATVPVLVVRDAAPFVAWASEARPLRIIVGVDASASSDPPLRLVELLRSGGACEVVVTQVFHGSEARARYGLERTGDWLEPDRAAEALVARDLEKRVGRLAGGGELELVASHGVGRLGDQLLELAGSKKADLIVVGSHQPRGFRRLSSVSSVVLHHANVAVAVAPAANAEPSRTHAAPVRCVLVAADLSERAGQALARAYDLLADRGGEVVLVHVMVTPRANEAVQEADLLARLRALEPRWAARHGIVTRAEIVRAGDVAHAVCTAAARVGADVICVAGRTSSALSRAVLGSHAERIVSQSDRAVLVVKPTPA